MYDDDLWQPVTKRSLRQDVLDRIRPKFDALTPPGRSTRVKWRSLPFYRDVILIRATDAAWPANLRLYWLSRGDRLYNLNGSSPPIHEVNSVADRNITQETARDYNHFFGHFVRGEDGPFQVLTGRDDPYWPASLPADVQDQLAAAVDACPAAAVETASGNFEISALVQYGRQFFQADYSVTPLGMIEMLSDEPLAFDALTAIDAPLAPPDKKPGARPGARDRRKESTLDRLARMRAALDDDKPARGRAVTPPAEDAAKPRTKDADRDARRNTAITGMKAAFGAFGQKPEPAAVRDFFYHWSLACSANGRNALAPPVASKLEAQMAALLEESGADRGVSEPRVRLLRALDAPEGQKPDLTSFRALLEPVGFAMAPDPDAFLASMMTAAPHMAGLMRQVAAGLRVSRRLGDGRIKLPPLLFVGPPGSGKSWAAEALCNALHLPHMTLSVGGGSDNRLFSGTPRGWATATPSIVAELLVRNRIANPALILEELDKSGGSQQNGNLAYSLLTALEPATAKAWMDECLCQPLDISHVNVIATANELEPIPRPLLNRMTIIKVAQPSAEDVIRQIDAVAANVVASFGGKAGEDGCLTANERDAIARRVQKEQLSFRDLRRVILEVLGDPPPGLHIVPREPSGGG